MINFKFSTFFPTLIHKLRSVAYCSLLAFDSVRFLLGWFDLFLAAFIISVQSGGAPDTSNVHDRRTKGKELLLNIHTQTQAYAFTYFCMYDRS